MLEVTYILRLVFVCFIKFAMLMLQFFLLFIFILVFVPLFTHFDLLNIPHFFEFVIPVGSDLSTLLGIDQICVWEWFDFFVELFIEL